MKHARIAGTVAAILIGLIFTLETMAQPAGEQTEAKQQTGEIRGTIRDAETGAPIANAVVFTDTARPGQSNGRMIAPTRETDGIGVSDSQGHYVLRNVEPGSRRVAAYHPEGIFNRRVRPVEVSAGQTVEGFDFLLRSPAMISGHVYDNYGEPVANVTVFQVVQEHFLGKARFYLRRPVRTDDYGAYTVDRIESGYPFRLMAQKLEPRLKAFSDAPIEAKYRRPAYNRIFYPDAPDLAGGTTLTLASGEHREGVDIVLRRSPSYCIEGVLESPAGKVPMMFWIRYAAPTFGTTKRGGTVGLPPYGQTRPDGRFRVCDLAAGDYVLASLEGKGVGTLPTSFSETPLTIVDRDLRDLRIQAKLPITVQCRVEWLSNPPETAKEPEISIAMQPVTRHNWSGQFGMLRSKIPGTFEVPRMFDGEYDFSFRRLPEGIYVAAATYGNESILDGALTIGSQPFGAEIRIRVGHDAGGAQVQLLDDGKPLGGYFVHLIPADAPGEEEMASRIQSGTTDLNGSHTFPNNIAPGDYFVVGSYDELHYSPQEIHALWLARSKAMKVTIRPGETSEVQARLLD